MTEDTYADALGVATPATPYPRVGRGLPGDHGGLPGGGDGPDGGFRRALGRGAARLFRFVRGAHFAPNPYVRHGWDQRYDPYVRDEYAPFADAHTIAAAGGDLGDDHAGADDRSTAYRHPEAGVPGQPGTSDALLEGCAHAYPIADASRVRSPDALFVRRGDGRLVHRLPRYAVGADWRERWDDR